MTTKALNDGRPARVLKSITLGAFAALTALFLALFIVPVKTGFITLPSSLVHVLMYFQRNAGWLSAVFVILFLTNWMLSVYDRRDASGWKRLSHKFSNRRTDFMQPSHLIAGSGKIGQEPQNGLLKTGTSPSGIVLKRSLLFRLGHRTLYIPWSEIAQIRKQKTLLFDNKLWRWLAKRFSPFDYARLCLKDFPDQLVLIRWDPSFDKNVPGGLFHDHDQPGFRLDR